MTTSYTRFTNRLAARVEAMHASTFFAVIACAFTLGGLALAGAVDRIRQQLELSRTSHEINLATAPIPYQTTLDSTLSIVSTPGAWMAIVRSEAETDEYRRQLCTLEAQYTSRLRFMHTGSDDVSDCGGRTVPIAPALMGSAGDDRIAGATVLIIEDDGRVMYSRGTLPTPEHLVRIFSLLHESAADS